MEQRKFNGDRLRNARIYNGISLTDLATQADIKSSLYHYMKMGRMCQIMRRLEYWQGYLVFHMIIFSRKIR